MRGKAAGLLAIGVAWSALASGACDETGDGSAGEVQAPAAPVGSAGDPPPAATAGTAAPNPTGNAGVQAPPAATPSSSVDAATAAPQQDAGAQGEPATMDDATVPVPDASTAGDAGADASADGDRCDEAVYDPAAPPQALTLSGSLGTHDPTLIEQDGTFYLWQTGPRVPGKTSTDVMRWQRAPSALGDSNPSWIAREVPGATDLWAPDVSYFGGQYHLYYSASTFGSNYSCIGHATRGSLDSGSWRDEGPVICSNHGSNDDWNAIDPNVVVDQAGTPWMSFGSFWSGIKAIELDQDGARADDEVHALASRGGGAIEAPVIVRRCGYYYLFVSFDRCCSGVDSTYNIRVGRSQQVLGPYVDRDQRPMMQGGGTLLVSGEGRWHGPGHNAVLFAGGRAYNVYHAYDGNSGGNPVLRVAELVWDEEGWPISGGP